MQEAWVLRVAPNLQAARLALSKHAGAVAVVNIVLSALLYLFDFATNIITLHTYYLVSYKCFNDPAYASASACDLAWKTSLDFNWVFPACLSIMVVAHVSNSLIFWMTLPAAQHPLRFAYFLPLIHLSRLFKVTWRTCSCTCTRLDDFQDNQGELSSLYNVLGASLETVPQLMLQFHVVMQLGITSVGESQQVPRTLILSLVASIASGTYNGSMAVLFLVQKSGMSFPWIAFIPLLAGFHTLAAIAARTMIVVALLPLEGYIYTRLIPILSYFLVGTIVTWIFSRVVLHKSHNNIFNQSSHKWVNQMRHTLHSLALAHVSLFIGPMYVIVKLFNEPYFFLLWGTFLHILVEIFGLITVLVSGQLLFGTDDVIPCQRDSSSSNKYLTCNIFLTVLCPSLILLLLSVVLFNVVCKTGRHKVLISEGEQHQAEMMDAELIISNDLEEKVAVEMALLPNCRQATSSSASSRLYISVVIILFIKKLSCKRWKKRKNL